MTASPTKVNVVINYHIKDWNCYLSYPSSFIIVVLELYTNFLLLFPLDFPHYNMCTDKPHGTDIKVMTKEVL